MSRYFGMYLVPEAHEPCEARSGSEKSKVVLKKYENGAQGKYITELITKDKTYISARFLFENLNYL